MCILCKLGIYRAKCIKKKEELEELESWYDAYNIDKFPVTSSLGNQYYAQIVYNHTKYNDGSFDCRIYIRDKNFEDKFICHKRAIFKNYDFEHDYNGILKAIIKEYETKIFGQ